MLFGSLQLTLVLIPDHIQTEALVDPCEGGRGMEAQVGQGPQCPESGGQGMGKAGMGGTESQGLVRGTEKGPGAAPGQPTDLPPECES